MQYYFVLTINSHHFGGIERPSFSNLSVVKRISIWQSASFCVAVSGLEHVRSFAINISKAKMV